MTIMGIDPGTARLGWAVIQSLRGHIRASSYGCITTDTTLVPAARLKTIYQQLMRLLIAHTPESLAMEDLFFATNAKTVIPVGEARGVILLTAANRNIPVVSYSPRAVKRAIAGDGLADKTQVTRMVMRILHLDSPPKPDDTADALAIALTHAYSYKLKGKLL